MKEEKRVFIGFQCEENLKTILETRAKNDKRSLSSLLEIIVEKWINENPAPDSE